MPTRTIRITRPTQVRSRILAVGQIVELPDDDARLLLALGKASAVLRPPLPSIRSAVPARAVAAVDPRAETADARPPLRLRKPSDRHSAL